MTARPFIHADFLLQSEPARALYHEFARDLPIVDFHNHLPPAQIAANHQFADLTELWLAGDHYKWRALRANGVAEDLITGPAAPREKFEAWAATVPFTLRNPLYHWTHLELKQIFGLDERLSPATAAAIWERVNAQLPQRRVHDLLALHRVRLLCTTDDPADPLDQHQAIARSGLATQVLPTFRADRALQLRDPAALNSWCERLEQTAGMPISSCDDLQSALKKRHDAFHALGGRLSDVGLETCPALPCSPIEANRLFRAARAGQICTPDEQAGYAAYLLLEFGCWHAARGWTQQLHLGALRNASTRQRRALGPDTGFDSIGDWPQIAALARYLDTLDATGELPRTILYNLNPADNYAFATLVGDFQEGPTAGKIQWGSGWWFLDQKEGIEWQLNALSSLGLLRRFIGMVTDSRSFLSFPRHDYFRRILCNLLGEDLRQGSLPDDLPLLGALVREICYENARDRFAPLPAPEPAL